MNTDFQIPTEFRCSPTFENLASRVRQFEWLHEKRAQEKQGTKSLSQSPALVAKILNKDLRLDILQVDLQGRLKNGIY